MNVRKRIKIQKYSTQVTSSLLANGCMDNGVCSFKKSLDNTLVEFSAQFVNI